MVTIEFDRDNLCVTAKGHAQSGEAGHDLVCAATSALIYTLAADVERLGHPSTIRLEEGDAEISCTPGEDYRLMVTFLFESLCVGFEMLSVDYPEFVSYSIVEG